MLAFDRNKVVAWNPSVFLSKNTGAPFAQLRNYDSPSGYDAQGLSGMRGLRNYDSPSGYDAQGLSQYTNGLSQELSQEFDGMGHSCAGCDCPECRAAAGLGFTDITGALSDVSDTFTALGTSGSVLGGVEAGLDFVPGVGPIASSVLSIFQQALSTFTSWIGSGRREENIIVPVQNQLMNQLGVITNGFRTGTTPSIYQLQQWYTEVWQLGLAFMEFVLKPQFTDRRASGQALNTVMPYIDGTCGYAVPLGSVATPSQSGCIRWGGGQLGGDGSDGMLGALGRAIVAFGGSIPQIGSIYQAAAAGVQPSSVAVKPVGTGYAYMATGTNFQAMLQQYGPYLLAGLGIMLLTRASKGR
jgi:hypothetical protein